MFKKVDFENWSRREYFIHYTEVSPCTYSLVVSLDITNLYHYSKEHNVKLYPLLLYVLATTVNETEEFRYSIVDDCVVNFNELSPAYTILNDDKSFSGIWSEYESDLKLFIENYNLDVKKYSNSGNMQPKSEKIDTFSVSMIPWLDFTAFNLNLKNDAKYLTPIFTIGKFHRENNRFEIPISIQVHHAIIDGYHVAKFANDLQKAIEEIK